MKSGRCRRHTAPSSRTRFAAVVLALGWCELAFAATDPQLELDWTAPLSCPGETTVQGRISELAPRPAPRERPLRVRATVEREDERFVLDLVLEDGNLVGKRRFEGDSCNEVVGAAAVAIALLLRSSDAARDAEAPADGSGDGAEAPEASPTGSAAEPGAVSQTSPSPTDATGFTDPPDPLPDAPRDDPDPAVFGSDRHWHAVVEAPSLAAGMGLLSVPGVGPSLGAGIEVERWRVSISGAWFTEHGVPFPGASGATAQVTRQIVRLSVCRWFLSGRFQVAPCGTAGVHRLVARGVGSGITSSEVSYPWALFGAQALGRLWMTDFVGFRLGTGVDVQAAQPALVIEGVEEVERIGALEFTAHLGAEWIF